jgi:hypothetical protein
MRMRQGGVHERAVPADGQTGRHPDRAESARIDANSTWSHWCGRGGGIFGSRCWKTGCDVLAADPAMSGCCSIRH